MENEVAHVPAEQRRQELISAAFRVMARAGVAAASTRAIAAEAGVPQSAFHYCFRSRSELLQELTTAVIEQMVDGATNAFEPDEDIERSIRAGFEIVWSSATVEPEHQLVLYELTTAVLRDPELRELAEWQYNLYFSTAGLFLDKISKFSGIEWAIPTPVLSRMIVTVVDGLMLNWLADRNTPEAGDVLDRFATMFAAFAVPTS